MVGEDATKFVAIRLVALLNGDECPSYSTGRPRGSLLGDRFLSRRSVAGRPGAIRVDGRGRWSAQGGFLAICRKGLNRRAVVLAGIAAWAECSVFGPTIISLLRQAIISFFSCPISGRSS